VHPRSRGEHSKNNLLISIKKSQPPFSTKKMDEKLSLLSEPATRFIIKPRWTLKPMRACMRSPPLPVPPVSFARIGHFRIAPAVAGAWLVERRLPPLHLRPCPAHTIPKPSSPAACTCALANPPVAATAAWYPYPLTPLQLPHPTTPTSSA